MDKLQQDFEEEYSELKDDLLALGHSEGVIDEELRLMSMVWKHAHNKYSKDNQKYIDLLKDIYYNYDLPNGVDQKIEKLLGDLL